MSTLKKLLASLASLATVLMTVAPAMAALEDVKGHWSESYVNDLVAKGVVDGTKASFRPDDAVNRAEVAKFVVQAFLKGCDNDVLPPYGTSTFQDVKPADWFFCFVETGAAYNIFTPKDNFLPNEPTNRAEMAKTIVEGAQLPTVSTSAGYTDVPADAWYATQVNTLAADCIIDASKGMYNPSANVTRGEMAKFVDNALKVAAGENLCTSTNPTDDTDGDGVKDGVDNCPTVANADQKDTDKNGVGDVCEGVVGPATSKLEVSKATTSPVSRTIPLGVTQVPLLDLKIANSGDEDVNITGVKVTVGGLGLESCLDGIGVNVGGRAYGSVKSVAKLDRTAAINITTDPVLVPKNTSVAVSLVADVSSTTSCAGNEYTANVLSKDDIMAKGVTTKGVVPVTLDGVLNGETQKIGTITVGQLSVFGRTLSNNGQEDVGTKHVEVSRFQMQASTTEDLLLQAVELDQLGGANDQDVANCTLEYNGAVLAGPVNQVSQLLFFDLSKGTDGGLALKSGDTRTISVYCDIVNGVGHTVQYGVRDTLNKAFRAMGQKFGFNANVVTGVGTDLFPNADDFVIRGGDLNFVLNSNAVTVPQGGKAVVLGHLSIINTGEDVDIQNLSVIFNPANGASASQFTNFKIFDTKNHTVVSGPVDGTNTTANALQTIALPDDFTVPSGTNEYDLLVDVAQGTPNNSTFFVTFDQSQFQVKGNTTNKKQTGVTGTTFKITPATNLLTKLVTIAQPHVDVVKASLASQTVVTRAAAQVLWRGTLTAGDAVGVAAKRLVFTFVNGNGGTDDNINNCAVVTRNGSITTVKQTGESVSGGSITFSDLTSDGVQGIVLPQGGQALVELQCDIASTLNNGSTGGDDTVTATLASVTAEDPQGNTASVSGTPVASGATFTLVSNGTLRIVRDTGAVVDPMVVIEDSTGVEIGGFLFTANKEKAKITKLTAKISGALADLDGDATNDSYDCDPVAGGIQITCYKDAVSKVSLYYADGTKVLTQGGGDASTSGIDANGRATINNLDLVVDTGNTGKLIFVRVDTSDIDTTSVGRSGMTFQAALSLNEGATPEDFKANGFASGTQYTTVGAVGSGLSVETNDGTAGAETTSTTSLMVLMNNNVIATKPTSQATSLADSTTQELMKFTLTPTGGNTTYLRKVIATITPTGTVTVNSVGLYSGATKIGTGVAAGNVWTFTIDAGYAQKVVIGGNNYDSISNGGETYTLKADVSGTAVNDVINTSIAINGLTWGADGIVWRDYGSDGTDGKDIRWIDLGKADTSTSQLTNRVDNK